jgi:hypothetical protein
VAEPFLAIDEFVSRYGDLGAGDTLTATDLLQTVSDWIRARVPDVDLVAAGQVVFEVVRDSLNLSEFAPLKQFENTTSRRTQSGTFVDADVNALLDDVVTDRQKRLLGIALRAAPTYEFAVNDLAMPHEYRGIGYHCGPYC